MKGLIKKTYFMVKLGRKNERKYIETFYFQKSYTIINGITL